MYILILLKEGKSACIPFPTFRVMVLVFFASSGFVIEMGKVHTPLARRDYTLYYRESTLEGKYEYPLLSDTDYGNIVDSGT